MKIYISLNGRTGKYSKENVLKIYKIGGFYMVVHEDHLNNELIFKIYFNKQIKNRGNKNLTKIYTFYEVLNRIEDSNISILWSSSVADKGVIERHGGQDMGEYYIANDKEDLHPDFGYNKNQDTGADLPMEKDDGMRRTSKLTLSEFYLLMQLYFGLYEEKELREELEDKDSNGEFDSIKGLLDYELYYKKCIEEGYKLQWEEMEKKFKKEILTLEGVENYSKLQLMRKDITGAFDGIEIKKIYDKNWDDDRKKESIEEINKEYGEEILVIEEE